MGSTSGLLAGVDLSMTDKNLGILVYEFAVQREKIVGETRVSSRLGNGYVGLSAR